MDVNSVNRSEYTHQQGEKLEAKRPKDSDILKGEGSFASDTHTRSEYVPKKGERYDPKKHDTSEIWKVYTNF